MFLLLVSLTGYAQHDCPAFSRSSYINEVTLIPTDLPTDPSKPRGIYLGEAVIETPVETRSTFIPDNKKHWAIGIAVAWNYQRNVIRRADVPQIGYFLGTSSQE